MHDTLSLTNISREATAHQYGGRGGTETNSLHKSPLHNTGVFFLRRRTFPDSLFYFLQGGVKQTLATLTLINIYSCAVHSFSHHSLHCHGGLLPGNPRAQWVLPHQGTPGQLFLLFCYLMHTAHP